jgi:hypothetical protein
MPQMTEASRWLSNCAPFRNPPFDRETHFSVQHWPRIFIKLCPNTVTNDFVSARRQAGASAKRSRGFLSSAAGDAQLQRKFQAREIFSAFV